MPEDNPVETSKALLKEICLFARCAGGITLRSYQVDVARAVVDSVLRGRGLSFVVMFPRQSGKNELQAQIETYLLLRLSATDAEIVKVSPTWKPQSLNAMRRLERSLERNMMVKNLWRKESGYIYRVGRARIFFFSGSPEANIVGATASALLEVDEAQDIQAAKFDKDIAPMAASTNATRVFWGTAWTGQTLLARELRAAREAEQRDGIRRVFRISADEVAREVPAYGRFVAEQAARLGRNSPMVRSQFYSEEIDAGGGMFPPARLALMQGSHPAQEAPVPGRVYAFLLDVAGEDEAAGAPGAGLANPARDATALTIVEAAAGEDSLLPGSAPLYRVVRRQLWQGEKHSALYLKVKALADLWNPRAVVIDATGVGAGLASFLQRALPGRVQPFIFNQASKSALGWNFIALADAGRFKDFALPEQPARGAQDDTQASLQEAFLRQAAYCQYETRPGPGKALKWGVPDGTRDPLTGELLHDDLLVSAALCAALEARPLLPGAGALIIHQPDPLEELSHGY
jgi:hypothetical protein